MKLFQKRPVAVAVMVLAMMAGVLLGNARRPDGEASTSVMGSYRYVMDSESVISEKTMAYIDSMNMSLFAQTGAQIAVDVGHVFSEEKTIMNFENLGIGRLIYQLPTTLCEMFLSEVFKKGSIESLDEETLFTIHKFFENNLNVSETSRKLFVHRNTLVYRLDKIKKLTGLDLREFDNAIVLKVALMVKQYLKSRELML